jgi:hypothetical protein
LRILSKAWVAKSSASTGNQQKPCFVIRVFSRLKKLDFYTPSFSKRAGMIHLLPVFLFE